MLAAPSVARVGEPITQTVLVKNLTDNVVEFRLEVQDDHEASGFAVGGLTRSTFQINPRGTYTVEHTLFTLTPGRVALPSILIKPQVAGANSSAKSAIPFWSSRCVFVQPAQAPLLL